VSSLSFYLACKDYKKPVAKNNWLQKKLYDAGFYTSHNAAVLWGMGFFGLAMRLLNFSSGQVEYGDAGGKLVVVFQYLMYAPLCLLFPRLLGLAKSNKKPVYFYIALIFILNIASNSRQAIINPIATYALLFMLDVFRSNKDMSKLISPAKLIVGGFVVVFFLGVLSDLSLAMLATRSIRSDVSKSELFTETIRLYQDDKQMQKLRSAKESTMLNGEGGENEPDVSYSDGWTEGYIDNFMLNRYSNLRITDEVLYYAHVVGWKNEMMQIDFVRRILILLPTPVLNFFAIPVNKEDLAFSRADLISSSNVRGYRVTSHVGDGLATFGYWYFPVQFVLFFCVFKLLNSFVFFTDKTIYSAFGLMNIFTFLGMFRNANGCVLDLSYCLRGFWQGVVTYLVVLFIMKRLTIFVKQ